MQIKAKYNTDSKFGCKKQKKQKQARGNFQILYDITN